MPRRFSSYHKCWRPCHVVISSDLMIPRITSDKILRDLLGKSLREHSFSLHGQITLIANCHRENLAYSNTHFHRHASDQTAQLTGNGYEEKCNSATTTGDQKKQRDIQTESYKVDSVPHSYFMWDSRGRKESSKHCVMKQGSQGSGERQHIPLWGEASEGGEVSDGSVPITTTP